MTLAKQSSRAPSVLAIGESLLTEQDRQEIAAGPWFLDPHRLLGRVVALASSDPALRRQLYAAAIETAQSGGESGKLRAELNAASKGKRPITDWPYWRLVMLLHDFAHLRPDMTAEAAHNLLREKYGYERIDSMLTKARKTVHQEDWPPSPQRKKSRSR
jgi:hypothetical protein